MNKKMEEVKEGNIRVVSEDFLQDVATTTKSLQELLSVHTLSPWGAEVKVEPVEVVAPRGKSGATVSKKSKAPVKEEGEAPSCLSLGFEIQGTPVAPFCLCGASPSVPLKWCVECCPDQYSSVSFSLGTEWQVLQAGRRQYTVAMLHVMQVKITYLPCLLLSPF